MLIPYVFMSATQLRFRFCLGRANEPWHVYAFRTALTQFPDDYNAVNVSAPLNVTMADLANKSERQHRP